MCLKVCLNNLDVFHCAYASISFSLLTLVSATVSNAWNPKPLFANQPTALKVLHQYLCEFERAYGGAALGNVVRLAAREPRALELDPSKTDPSEIPSNAERLVGLFHELVSGIVSSRISCPPSLRILSAELKRVAADAAVVKHIKGYDAAQDVVGFLYLRYLVPALAAPDEFNIVSEAALTANTRRTLALLSRLLLLVLRRTPFEEAAEDFWKVVNPSVHSLFDHLRDVAISIADAKDVAPLPLPATAVRDQEVANEGEGGFKPTVSEESYGLLLRQQDLRPLLASLDRNAQQIHAVLLQNGAGAIAVEFDAIMKAIGATVNKRASTVGMPRK